MEESEANLRARMEEAEKLITKIGRDKLDITETLLLKRYNQAFLLARLEGLHSCKNRLVHILIHERRKMDVLQLLPQKLRFADNAYKKKPITSCLSAKEISKHKLHFRMVHGNKSLAKEKQLLEEIKVSQKQQEEEDDFASFWTQWEEDRVFLSEHTGWKKCRSYQNKWQYLIDLHTLKQTSWLQHQMPFLISKGDTKNREGEIRELEWRLERCGVILQNYTGNDTPIASNRNRKANPTFVKMDTRTNYAVKKALQEQIKLAGIKIEETRKLQLTLRDGPKIGQVQIELVAIEKDIDSLMKKLPPIEQRKYEAHQCLLKLSKQLAEVRDH